jgi:hypothetical protein
MESSPSDPQKSIITQPTLFITNLPTFITEEDDLKDIFNEFDITHVCIGTVESGSRDDISWRAGKGQVAQVNFSRIEDGTSWKSIVVTYTSASVILESAEKALATLHLRPISKTNPPVLLFLSITSGCTPLATSISGNPRLVKLLPQDFTDATLYDFLRPFGPLASVRVDRELGGIVQFWTESDALTAELAVREKFARKSKITLQAYNPCNLYCAVCLQLSELADWLITSSPEISEGDLRTRFKQVSLGSCVPSDK